MKKINIEELNASGISYQIELVDYNCNSEIIEENIDSLDKAKEKALHFVNYENNLSEYDKKKSYVLVSEVEGDDCNSIIHYEFGYN